MFEWWDSGDPDAQLAQSRRELWGYSGAGPHELPLAFYANNDGQEMRYLRRVRAFSGVLIPPRPDGLFGETGLRQWRLWVPAHRHAGERRVPVAAELLMTRSLHAAERAQLPARVLRAAEREGGMVVLTEVVWCCFEWLWGDPQELYRPYDGVWQMQPPPGGPGHDAVTRQQRELLHLMYEAQRRLNMTVGHEGASCGVNGPTPGMWPGFRDQ